MPLMEKVPDFYCQIQFVTFIIMSELCVIAWNRIGTDQLTERPTSIIHLRRLGSSRTACVGKTASPSCIAVKASPKVSITKGRNGFMEANKWWLAGDTAGAATTDE
jgi:hypothetical protein